jgi:hypothetical protein
MIIGISGKLHAGKNMVADIIQVLMWMKEASRNGDYILKEDHDEVTVIKDAILSPEVMVGLRQSGFNKWELKAFAYKVKLVASILTGYPVEKFEDQEFKKQVLGPEWSRYVVSDTGNRITPVVLTSIESAESFKQAQLKSLPYLNLSIDLKPITIRQLLQLIGTEAMRERVHSNVWVNALFADYHPAEMHTVNQFEPYIKLEWLPNWLITDPRFPNEIEAIEKHNGIVIRVERPGIDRSGPEHWHKSETALDGHYFKHILVNDGSLKDLIIDTKALLQTIKLL